MKRFKSVIRQETIYEVITLDDHIENPAEAAAQAAIMLNKQRLGVQLTQGEESSLCSTVITANGYHIQSANEIKLKP